MFWLQIYEKESMKIQKQSTGQLAKMIMTSIVSADLVQSLIKNTAMYQAVL